MTRTIEQLKKAVELNHQVREAQIETSFDTEQIEKDNLEFWKTLTDDELQIWIDNVFIDLGRSFNNRSQLRKRIFISNDELDFLF